MHEGKIVFAQLMDHLPLHSFAAASSGSAATDR